MNVSVIIPAHDSACTITKTLESLLDQTFPYWEAIVIDDDSRDRTCAIVEDFLQRDGRFRLIAQPRMGVSAARNRGIQASRYEWLLFLDSDDWILPQHLEQLTKVLQADLTLDAAYCGWTYITPDGEEVFGDFGGPVGNLFAQHAQYCFSVIHTYVVRRCVVDAVGGFDAAMQTCEDWDLWQRVARSGARFGTVAAKLAAYRIRSGSLTANGYQLFADGVKVLTRGHSPDLRVPQQNPAFPKGLPLNELESCKLGLLCACAGYLIGSRKDARPLLLDFEDKCRVSLDAYEVAKGIFIHAMVAAAEPRRNWYRLWADLKGNSRDFLLALEDHTGIQSLARNSERYLKHLAAEHATDSSLIRRVASRQAHFGLGIRELFVYLDQKVQFLKHLMRAVLSLMPGPKHCLLMLKQRSPHSRLTDGSAKEGSGQMHFETLFTKKTDPWNYASVYEQTKYEQTLSLIPQGRINRALELACAEGRFTCQLAPRVEYLLANDISQLALDRAAERCKKYGNVRFQHFDFMNDPVPKGFDLIVCSEVLYYVDELKKLRMIRRKLIESLNPNGYLLMTHAKMIADDPTSPGFDWGHSFGARTIGTTFAQSRYLEGIRQFHTPLYEVQLFRRRARPRILPAGAPARVAKLAKHGVLPPHLASQVVWKTSNHLPILRYSHVGPVISSKIGGRGVLPSAFEEQLRYLCEAGYRSITLEKWRWAVNKRTPLKGSAVFIAFDEASRDFMTYAWPLLQRYGFSASLFLYTDEVGLSKTRDPVCGDEIRPLSWKQVQELQAGGLTFGPHSSSRCDLTSLPFKKIIGELKRSQDTLENQLATSVVTLAYAGKSNRIVQYLAAACGYRFGLSNKPGLCAMNDSLLALPCIRMESVGNLEAFAGQLGCSQQRDGVR